MPKNVGPADTFSQQILTFRHCVIRVTASHSVRSTNWIDLTFSQLIFELSTGECKLLLVFWWKCL